ncbi:MAG: 1-acyl-sn-glycerol-3-phosphate acyltransferase [Polyangiales bacterium]|jgi:1-acyl-sn-glycerol-3-phosphate acyltransferase
MIPRWPQDRGSVLAFVRTLAETAKVSAPILVDRARGKLKREGVDRRIKRWAKNTVRISGVDLEISGLEHIDPRRTYVVMSNHQSNYDIVAIYHAFPSTLRMVAKQEMRKLPLMGSAMEAAEFIFVDRSNNTAARRALDSAKERIHSGVNVWIAPEGTRSESGEVGPFKKGGFMLAISAGVAILPCTVDGTRDVMPIKAASIHLGKKAKIQFHPPIETSDYGLDGRDRLMEDVRASILSGF